MTVYAMLTCLNFERFSCDVSSDIFGSESDSERKVMSSYTCSADVSKNYQTSEAWNFTIQTEHFLPGLLWTNLFFPISYCKDLKKSDSTLVPESLTPISTPMVSTPIHRSRTSSICSTDSRHSLTPNRSLVARLHHVKLATETSRKLLDFYKILNENGSRLIPDGTVTMARLAKHFRIIANLEYLLDLIEGFVQEDNRKDESSRRSSTSRTWF